MEKPLEVIEPRTAEEACGLLSRHGKEARPLAGGTDLLLKWQDGKVEVRYFIDLCAIPGLDRIEVDPAGRLAIGALARIQGVVESPLIRERWPVLAEAAEELGSPQVRNLATVGGNLCNASPAADMAPPLLVLGARAFIQGPGGERSLPLEELFSGPGETRLSPAEVLTRLEIPPLPERSGAVYVKFGPRRAMDIALVAVAVFARLEADGEGLAEVRIALGAVGPTPLRARRAEEALNGRGEEAIEEAAGLAAGEAAPISDIRSSASYRREMVRVLAGRGLRLALKRAASPRGGEKGGGP